MLRHKRIFWWGAAGVDKTGRKSLSVSAPGNEKPHLVTGNLLRTVLPWDVGMNWPAAGYGAAPVAGNGWWSWSGPRNIGDPGYPSRRKVCQGKQA